MTTYYIARENGTVETMTDEKQIKKAVRDTIDLIGTGWNIETATLCCHDGIYDIIEVDEFITLIQNEIKEMVSF
jgi:rRNA processing protein Krr1/Pno1